ncbi:MAG: UDP-N-acetylglucosamine 2-epimerase (non-hydrolyzing), partial [Clostridia bacterium]|nr:UDP-N-acetylglucosamine 2-epimerase (non-hydrolyzing) [Clostridia bacterium]
MKRIAAVFGTRPEAIKMCPLIKELKSRGADVRVILSGQHKEMTDSVMKEFNVDADINLSVMRAGQDLGSLAARLAAALDELYKKEKFDTVMVHGDTLTAYFAALFAFFYKIPIAHIEAGLRTYDINNPYPEELCRRAISLIADYSFAPTDIAMKNLLSEGIKSEKIFVSGNTVIDAVCQTVSESYPLPLLDFAKGGRLAVLTAHRRENIGYAMESS